MSTIERIVRPALPASIRVTSVPDAAPAVSSEADRVSITGSGGSLIALSHSAQDSWKKSHQNAQFGLYDLVRITNPCNPKQYVDVKHWTFVRMKNIFGVLTDNSYWRPQEQPANCAEGRAGIRVLSRDNQETFPELQIHGAAR